MRILAERFRAVQPPRAIDQVLVTVGDAARLLQVSRQGVHKLVATEQLTGYRTLSRQLFFHYGHVMQAVHLRAAARVTRRGELLASVRVRMLKAAAAGEARQLALDFSARLKLVGARGKGRKVA